MLQISQQEYQQRRQQLIDNMQPNSVAIIVSGVEHLRNGDTVFPFRQNSDFYYLTGFAEPQSVAVIAPNYADGEFILFNRPKDPAQEQWVGRRVGQKAAMTDYGADVAYEFDKFAEILPDILSNRQHLYFALGRYPEADSIILNALNTVRNKIRAGVRAPINIINVEQIIHEMRLIKSPAEIALLRKACEISVNAHQRAMKRAEPGIWEYQLGSEIMHEFLDNGCMGEGYPSIIGSGDNACILHYTENNQQAQEGDLVLIDAGGEYCYYGADITRTFPVNGKFSEPQRQIYELVLKSQLAAIEMVRPGTPWNRIQMKIVEVLTQGLLDLGILQGSVEQLIESKAYLPFYMHNSGHWLGLDTHDAGSYKQNGTWRNLEAGMVLTVEPGLYFSPDLSGIDSQWLGIGVRIEDDILVTEHGHDVLSVGLVKTVADVEALMAQQ